LFLGGSVLPNFFASPAGLLYCLGVGACPAIFRIHVCLFLFLFPAHCLFSCFLHLVLVCRFRCLIFGLLPAFRLCAAKCPRHPLPSDSHQLLNLNRSAPRSGYSVSFPIYIFGPAALFGLFVRFMPHPLYAHYQWLLASYFPAILASSPPRVPSLPYCFDSVGGHFPLFLFFLLSGSLYSPHGCEP